MLYKNEQIKGYTDHSPNARKAMQPKEVPRRQFHAVPPLRQKKYMGIIYKTQQLRIL